MSSLPLNPASSLPTTSTVNPNSVFAAKAAPLSVMMNPRSGLEGAHSNMMLEHKVPLTPVPLAPVPSQTQQQQQPAEVAAAKIIAALRSLNLTDEEILAVMNNAVAGAAPAPEGGRSLPYFKAPLLEMGQPQPSPTPSFPFNPMANSLASTQTMLLSAKGKTPSTSALALASASEPHPVPTDPTSYSTESLSQLMKSQVEALSAEGLEPEAMNLSLKVESQLALGSSDIPTNPTLATPNKAAGAWNNKHGPTMVSLDQSQLQLLEASAQTRLDLSQKAVPMRVSIPMTPSTALGSGAATPSSLTAPSASFSKSNTTNTNGNGSNAPAGIVAIPVDGELKHFLLYPVDSSNTSSATTTSSASVQAMAPTSSLPSVSSGLPPLGIASSALASPTAASALTPTGLPSPGVPFGAHTGGNGGAHGNNVIPPSPIIVKPASPLAQNTISPEDIVPRKIVRHLAPFDRSIMPECLKNLLPVAPKGLPQYLFDCAACVLITKPDTKATYSVGWEVLQHLWGINRNDFDAAATHTLRTKDPKQQEAILFLMASLDLSDIANLSAFLISLIKQHERRRHICLHFLLGICEDHKTCPAMHPAHSPGWDLLRDRWGVTYKDMDYAVLSNLAKRTVQERETILTMLAGMSLKSIGNMSAFVSTAIRKYDTTGSTASF